MHMGDAWRLTAELTRSEASENLVLNGIAPDGTVDWRGAGIVRALKERQALCLSMAGPSWTLRHTGLRPTTPTTRPPGTGAAPGPRCCTSPGGSA